MEIETKTVGNVEVLKLLGRFDAESADLVHRALQQTIPAYSRIVVDLKEVAFMDSAALATLVQGLKRCRQAGGDLRLCNLQQPVQVIFELTRLDRAFALFDTSDAAVRSFHD